MALCHQEAVKLLPKTQGQLQEVQEQPREIRIHLQEVQIQLPEIRVHLLV